MYVQKDRRFSGATVPGRPAHVQAADAKRHTEAKLGLHKAILTESSALKSENKAAQSPSALEPAAPKGGEALDTRDANIKSVTPPASGLSVQQYDYFESQQSSDAAEVHVDKAGHVALDAFDSNNAKAGGSTGLLKVGLAPTSAVEDGAVSVTLELVDFAPAQANSTADSASLKPAGPFSNNAATEATNEAASPRAAPSKPLSATPGNAQDGSLAVIDVGDLSLPASPTVITQTPAEEAALQEQSDAAVKVVTTSKAFSSALGVGHKSEGSISNPLYSGAGDSVHVDM